MMARDPLAARLLDLADRVARLPAYSHRRPAIFFENRDELAGEIRDLAHEHGLRANGQIDRTSLRTTP